MAQTLVPDSYEEFLRGNQYARTVNGRPLKNVDSLETLFCIEVLLEDGVERTSVQDDTLTLTLITGSVFTFTKLSP